MGTVLKLDYNDGMARSYSFTEKQVKEIKINTMQDEDLQELANGKPVLYKVSNEYKVISILLEPTNDPGIFDNVNVLVDVEEMIDLTMYYQNGEEAHNFQVKIDPRTKQGYVKGGRSTEAMLLIFYQASELISALEYAIFVKEGLI